MGSKIVVLVSGSGSNLQALLDATLTGNLDAEITAVFSNKRDAYGLTRARDHGIPAIYFPYGTFKRAGRVAYDFALAKRVAEYQPDLIVLAGWMRILTAVFLDAFPQRVINLHPALPGTYIGANGVDWAWEGFQSGEISQTGCMVHYTTTDLDEGPVIDSAVVPFREGETKKDFIGRLRVTEHQLIVRATQKTLLSL